MTRGAASSNWAAKRWRVALGISTLQIAVGVYVMVSSSRDIISDGACMGGLFGAVANLWIGGLATLVALVLAVKTFNAVQWHPFLGPLLVVIASSVIAVFLGTIAALRCTV
ncbi:hypothetical protein ROE7235_02926 [Roseibaca ekhonensis]|jgi:hypothetical protein|uniref:Uncharacterized protein n=1 Tax=Roseinatronobacter ekhonensis TaxID=254356 RepID=A0A3B0MHZ8_9RHOB|nr:hypothetical protein [Roseibaca ekhonensis]SUZ33158.1 hypothetical protein ROE7235_02926 [Roseibaca ekhonensis]